MYFLLCCVVQLWTIQWTMQWTMQYAVVQLWTVPDKREGSRPSSIIVGIDKSP